MRLSLKPTDRNSRLAVYLAIGLASALHFPKSIRAEGEIWIQPGDRIAMVGNSLADQLRRYGYLETELKRRLPSDGLVFRNLGWAGDAVGNRARPENFESESASLAEFKADVIFASFGIGESFAGSEGLVEFDTALQALVDGYRQNTYNGHSTPRLVLISPMAFEEFGIAVGAVDDRNRDLALYADAVKRVADRNKIGYVDLFNPSLSLVEDVEASKLTTNGVILSPYGSWVASNLIADAITPDDGGALISIGGIKSVSAENAVVSDVEAVDGNGFSWRLSSSNWRAPPPEGSVVHRSLRRWTDRIAARDLQPGVYALWIDGLEVVKASHAEWSEGIALFETPGHNQVETFRRAVVGKNEQYFHSWRALNQVHIVGTRRKSPSGRAIPAELQQFRSNAESGEASLQQYPRNSGNSLWEFRKVLD